jgi:ureidoglycolate dehydrogenase (NAD+)
MADDVRLVSPEDLKKITVKKLLEVKVPLKDAETVADILVFADLRGVHSHGVIRVEHYMNRIRSGGINLQPRLEVKALKPSVGLLDAQGALGHVSTMLATEHALKTARTEGMALVGIKNNSHCGALAYYVQMALDARMAALVLVNTDIRVVPFGGKDAYFGTNPFAFGFPGAKESILLDMATSEVAWGKILTAREKGQTLKDGWAVDKDGSSTTDPKAAVNLYAFGGAKGYGITAMVEALTGLMIGGIFGPHLNRMYEDVNTYRDLSNFIMVIDPSVFDPFGGFLERTQRMIDELHAVPPAPGVERVLIPGEIERKVMAKYSASGIPVPVSIYGFLTR